ncbi:1261_t:CDS:1, partial [Dentiscutata heterogama]
FTKISLMVWANTPFITNADELAHSNINQSGCELSLLAAI